MALRVCNQISRIKYFNPECNICNKHVMDNEGHFMPVHAGQMFCPIRNFASNLYMNGQLKFPPIRYVFSLYVGTSVCSSFSLLFLFASTGFFCQFIFSDSRFDTICWFQPKNT